MRRAFLIPIVVAASVPAAACSFGVSNRLPSPAVRSDCVHEGRRRVVDRTELPLEMIAGMDDVDSTWSDRPPVYLVSRFTDPRCRD